MEELCTQGPEDAAETDLALCIWLIHIRGACFAENYGRRLGGLMVFVAFFVTQAKLKLL